jgi:hypothetical protein
VILQVILIKIEFNSICRSLVTLVRGKYFVHTELLRVDSELVRGVKVEPC